MRPFPLFERPERRGDVAFGGGGEGSSGADSRYAGVMADVRQILGEVAEVVVELSVEVTEYLMVAAHVSE
jgi:hypothetical protein